MIRIRLTLRDKAEQRGFLALPCLLAGDRGTVAFLALDSIKMVPGGPLTWVKYLKEREILVINDDANDITLDPGPTITQVEDHTPCDDFAIVALRTGLIQDITIP